MRVELLPPPSTVEKAPCVVEPKFEGLNGPKEESLDARVLRFQETRSPQLYNSIAAEMMPELGATAARFHSRAGLPRSVDRDDLVQCGSVGLISAINSFDPTRGASFRVYAQHRIEGAMLDGLRAEDPLTRHERATVRALERAVERLTVQDGSPPSDEDIQAATKLSEGELRSAQHLLRVSRMVSIEGRWEPGYNVDAPASSGGAGQPYDIADVRTPPVDDRTVRGELWELVGRCLRDDRERRIIEGHLRDGEQLRDVGAELGISSARATQVKLGALQRLRLILEKDWPARSLFGALKDRLFGGQD